MPIASLFQIIGGVGLFLYGVKLMSDALQDIAGNRMRRLVSSLTNTPIKGVFIGALVTILLQSSSATTVMTVSFVQSGLMTLKQAVGVIMGANIGTTTTAQLIAFNVKDFALPVIGIGMILALFGRTKNQKYFGNGLFGFGLLFLGMSTMENSMMFMRDRKDFFLYFAQNPLMGVLAGTVLTMIVQSSAATIGLTIAMASQGLIPLNAAIPILLGDNIGTTITAVIASLGSGRAAKQAAASHVLFNVIGTCLVLSVLPLFEHIVTMSASGVERQIANAHTLFNISATVVMLPFVNVFVKLVRKLVPDSKKDANDLEQGFLEENLIDASPAAAVNAVQKEFVRMGNISVQMLDMVHKAFNEQDASQVDKLNKTEKILNSLTYSMANYAAKLFQKHMSSDLTTLLSSYVNGASDIERIGDHAQNLVELYTFMRENDLRFSDLAMEEFNEMFRMVREAVYTSVQAVENENLIMADKVTQELEEQIDQKEEQLRKSHVKRLNDGECQPAAGVIFIDILSNLERVGDHAHNIALIVNDTAKIKNAGFADLNFVD